MGIIPKVSILGHGALVGAPFCDWLNVSFDAGESLNVRDAVKPVLDVLGLSQQYEDTYELPGRPGKLRLSRRHKVFVASASGAICSHMREQGQWHEYLRVLQVGGGDYHAPVQTIGDFLAGRATRELGSVASSYEPGVTPSDLRDCLPPYVVATLKEAIPAIDRLLRGFAMPDAVLVGVETRSSSPLRITRTDETCESISTPGLFPAGEGAGYAGGIISAAVDGMRVAERILNR